MAMQIFSPASCFCTFLSESKLCRIKAWVHGRDALRAWKMDSGWMSGSVFILNHRIYLEMHIGLIEPGDLIWSGVLKLCLSWPLSSLLDLSPLWMGLQAFYPRPQITTPESNKSCGCVWVCVSVCVCVVVCICVSCLSVSLCVLGMNPLLE